MGYVIAGGTVIGLAALMAHGDSDEGWFSGTMQMVGVMVMLGTAAALLVWVATYGN